MIVASFYILVVYHLFNYSAYSITRQKETAYINNYHYFYLWKDEIDFKVYFTCKTAALVQQYQPRWMIVFDSKHVKPIKATKIK